jgi:hypothetical protein
MILKYVVTSPMMHDARNQAIRRAEAEGWSKISITNVQRIAYDTYEFTLIVGR